MKLLEKLKQTLARYPERSNYDIRAIVRIDPRFANASVNRIAKLRKRIEAEQAIKRQEEEALSAKEFVALSIRIRQCRFRVRLAILHSRCDAVSGIPRAYWRPVWGHESAECLSGGARMSDECVMLDRYEAIRSDAILSERFGGLGKVVFMESVEAEAGNG